MLVIDAAAKIHCRFKILKQYTLRAVENIIQPLFCMLSLNNFHSQPFHVRVAVKLKTISLKEAR
jgi:hypothetical protein